MTGNRIEGPQGRALGMWQALFTAYASGQAPDEFGPDRGIVSRDDAADAVFHAAIRVDAAMNEEGLHPNTDTYIMFLLMAVRDHLAPLPWTNGPGEAERLPDPVCRDLDEAVAVVRAAGPTTPRP